MDSHLINLEAGIFFETGIFNSPFGPELDTLECQDEVSAVYSLLDWPICLN